MTLMTGNEGTPPSDEGQSGDKPPVVQEQVTWKDALPDDVKNHASMQTFTDIQALAKSYINAQSMIGRDKIIAPTEHSSEEDWKEVYAKLGMPDAEKYAIDGIGEEPTDFDNNFKELMVKNNVLPRQAKEIYGFLKGVEKSQSEAAQADYDATIEEGIKDLREEWGAAFDQNLMYARSALQTFGNEDLYSYLEETGMGDDPMLLRVFTDIGKKLGEDKFLGETKLGQITPAEAQRKIDTIMDNPEHPYHLNEHSGHANALKEVEKLFQDLTQ